MSPHAERLRRLTQPLLPEDAGESPRLTDVEGCRAVAFDIYGTLFLSACGDIGLTAPASRAESITEALRSQGFTSRPADSTDSPGVGIGERFVASLEAAQERERAKGTEWPEVDIREVWRDFLAEAVREARVDGPPLAEEVLSSPALEALAVHDEALNNPVWPAPNLEKLLDALRRSELPLGIVSNAQFYTPHLFEAFLGNLPSALGFADDLQIYSYQFREGKPSTALYRRLAEGLEKRGIAPKECLYLGNDRLKDVWPAQQVGFKTALYAGDARSLRWRHDDGRLEGVEPDLVITDLWQVAEVLGLE